MTTPPRAQVPGRRILLFVDGRSRAASRQAIAQIKREPWALGCVPEIVDIQRDRELADWFGIVRLPAIAVVDDGMLVAIEHECTKAACDRVSEMAAHRDDQLRDRRL